MLKLQVSAIIHCLLMSNVIDKETEAPQAGAGASKQDSKKLSKGSQPQASDSKGLKPQGLRDCVLTKRCVQMEMIQTMHTWAAVL